MEKKSYIFRRGTGDNKLIAKRQTRFSIGYDLHSSEEILLGPFQLTIVNTGYFVDLYKNAETGSIVYGEIRPRVNLILKKIYVHTGIIDSDYKEELKVIMENKNDQPVTILKNERVAQFILKESNIKNIALFTDDNKIVESKQISRISGFGSTGRII